MTYLTVQKVSEIIEKLETLKKAKKRYVVESSKHHWSRVDLENSLWSKIAQPIINKIEIDLVELWPCIIENGSGKWTRAGIEDAIESIKPDLMDPLIQEFKVIRRKLEIKSQQQPKPAETEQDTTPAKRGRIGSCLKRNPHIYGLTGGIIFLILFFVLGLFKAQWRSWCWGTAGLAFLVLILSLLGGRSSR